MSDTATQFHDAFADAFDCFPYQLFCTWHVDKAWRENLRKNISNLEIEGEVYKYLRTVLEQTDQLLFEDYLGELIKRVESSPLTMSFCEYFKNEWVNNKTCWGYAYRVSFGINTNMFCEAIHRAFERKGITKSR